VAPEAAELLVRYPWHGNVRELKNCAEYLACLDKRAIEARDLQPVLKWPGPVPRDPAPGGPLQGAEAFREAPGVPREHCLFLLECLYDHHRNRVRAGRRSLVAQAQARDLFLTEAQVRKALVRMEGLGYVRLSPGRGGTAITPAGIAALRGLGQPPWPAPGGSPAP
jgi:DNA-binding NtrC family response regulator